MVQIPSRRAATGAICGGLLLLWGHAWAAPSSLQTGAGTALEVRVLDARVQPQSGQPDAVTYHMEVISVLRSRTRVKPGDTIVVHAEASRAPDQDAGVEASGSPRRLTPGWMGVAYLDPIAQGGAGGGQAQFRLGAGGESFADIKQGPPSATWTEYRRPGE